jgi:hypothetical protein
MFKKIHLAIGGFMILWYTVGALLGWTVFSPTYNQLPSEYRGNYRNFNFGVWHTSFHGGK